MSDEPPADRSPEPELPPVFGFDDGVWEERLRQAESISHADPVGPYVDLVEIGRGGQGVVFKARHARTGNTVALKRLAAGSFASSSARRRFQRELETVASLDHPHIVGWLGVEVSGGQSLLAMEWVSGDPVTLWAGPPGGRSPRECVSMVVRVCEAVQYAHRHGVIHRDLKPSNILVDGEGEPRVLDFGLARSVEDEGRVTRSSEFVGTPGYASPEQCGLAEGSVDIRADVFSLGVVLFEVLTGALPYAVDDPDRFRRVAMPRPSHRVSGIARDLDLVVAKAIQPDADHRYPTVDALTEDLACFLRGEAVSAHPPSTFYSLKKLVMRNRLAAALVAVLLVTVTLFAGHSAYQARNLQQERDAALSARALADQQRNATESVLTFLSEGILADAHPRRRGRDVTVVEAMTSAGIRVPTEFSGDPRLRGRIEAMLGRGHLEIGRFTDAAGFLTGAAERTEDPVERAMVLADLARAEMEVGGYELAEEHLREAIVVLGRGGRLDDAARVTADLVRHLSVMCRFDEAEELAQAGISRFAGGAAEFHSFLALAEVARSRCRFADAEADLRWAILAADDDQVREALARYQLSIVLEARGDLDRALQEARTSHALRLDRLTEAHRDTSRSRFRVAWVEFALGRPDAALQLIDEAEDPAATIGTVEKALVLRAAGRLPEALELLREERKVVDELYAGPHISRVNIRMAIGENQLLQRDVKGAEAEVVEALEIARALHAKGDHPDVAFCLNGMGLVLKTLRRDEEAAACYLESAKILRAFFPDGHPNLVVILNNLGQMAYRAASPDGERFFGEALAAAKGALPEDHPDHIDALTGYATCRYFLAGDHEEALPLLRDALARIDRSYAAEPRPEDIRRRARTERRLGGCLLEGDDLDEAVHYLQASYDRLSTGLGPLESEAIRSAGTLAKGLGLAGRAEDAKIVLEAARAAVHDAIGSVNDLWVQLCLSQIKVCLDHGDPSCAEKVADEVLALPGLPPDLKTLFEGWRGAALCALDRADEGRPLVEQALPLVRKGPSGPPADAIVRRFEAALAIPIAEK